MTKEIEDIIVSLYKQGNSLRTIGKKTGHSHLFVWKILKSNSIVLRSRGWHKCSFTYQYFRDYTRENSYWMGFIAADGHVNVKRDRIELKIHSRDVDRLIAFRSALNGDLPIYRFKTRPHVGIIICSKEMVSDLVEKGVGPKAYALRVPAGIPDVCVRHFIRGCFDGDGSISLIRCGNRRPRPLFQILGSEHLLKWIKMKLMEQAQVNSFVRIRSEDGCWALRAESWRSLSKLRDYFYSDVVEQLYMKRKKEKFDFILKNGELPIT